MMKWGWGGMPDGYGVFVEGLIKYLDWAFVVGLVIFNFIFVLLVMMLFSSGSSEVVDSVYLEFIWTLLPVGVLIFMGYPSMLLMYMYEEGMGVDCSFKVVGAQWYWIYGMLGEEGSSYMGEEGFRLFDVGDRLVLPSASWVGLYVTSVDVIHSWALEAMGVKVDAIPGRVNYVSFFSGVPGVYYGQCSELCGVGHSFMPIGVEVVV
uniref:Cytochrome c oxidase subunit 2 n=1 Tax=Polyacanthorhynchus caballeroi TaxID=178082 RepID=A0A140DJ81_9BILA|nr:cytochrome c oxidase subunit II [Polyacanthorhynchus caballeroi]AMK47835.1 cytochrome c oxidase subunit 2 [Polyacanthorhynchus caballeroi]